MLVAWASSAHGAIALRDSGCASTAGTTINVTRPAAAQPGDLELVTIAATANNSDGIFQPGGSGWTWAGVGSANNGLLMASFWRRAAAGDPAQWTFYMFQGSGSAMSYSLSVFSGADPVNPPLVAANQTAAAAAAGSHPFPDSTGPYDGMIRYIASGARANVSQGVAGGPTTTCNQQIANASLLAAHELVANGTTPTRTVTHATSAEAILHSILIRPACSAGGLSLSPPGAIGFPPAALTGGDGFSTTSFSVGIDDQRASSAGWRLSLSAGQFTAPGATLPANAATITSLSASPAVGQCSAPVNSITYPVTLSDTPIAIYNNAPGSTGQGPATLTVGARLDYPASTRIGTYTSVWTFSLDSGP